MNGARARKRVPTIDNPPHSGYSIRPPEEDEAVDELLISDLECNECGDEVEANCPVHDEQELATMYNGKLRCTEWDYERGQACGLPLTVVCRGCDNEEVEI